MFAELKDRWLWVALIAALPVWAIFWWIEQPASPFEYFVSNYPTFFKFAILYPIMEEIVFRGAIQGAFVYRYPSVGIGPISLGNALTSILFALLHAGILGNFLALLVFFPSLVFGKFRERTGNLAIPILLHIFYNSGFLFATSKY